MKPTEMPVWRPTADSIWNIFRSSGKRHLLVTGSRGSGKTTLLNALAGKSLPGITTWAVPGVAVFLRENGTNRQVRIGLYDVHLPGKENKMQPIYFGFSGLGIPALRRCMEHESEWIYMDEIGYLECACAEYCCALELLMTKKHLLAAVRKQEIPFLRSLLERDDVFVIDLDQPFAGLGCVIMASGMGKRFGGNKLMAPFRGRPLIDRVLAATDGIFERRVVVTRSEATAAHCREMGIPTVLHEQPFRSDTVRLGLEALAGVWGCMFFQADQPLIQPDTIRLLALMGANFPDSICRPRCGTQPGAPIFFSGAFFSELEMLPQGKGGGYVAKQHPDCVQYLEIQSSVELRDIDTSEDLRELEVLKVDSLT